MAAAIFFLVFAWKIYHSWSSLDTQDLLSFDPVTEQDFYAIQKDKARFVWIPVNEGQIKPLIAGINTKPKTKIRPQSNTVNSDKLGGLAGEWIALESPNSVNPHWVQNIHIFHTDDQKYYLRFAHQNNAYQLLVMDLSFGTLRINHPSIQQLRYNKMGTIELLTQKSEIIMLSKVTHQ